MLALSRNGFDVRRQLVDPPQVMMAAVPRNQLDLPTQSASNPGTRVVPAPLHQSQNRRQPKRGRPSSGRYP